MKTILSLLFIILVFSGCYRQVTAEKPIVPVDIKVMALDEPAPSQDEADIVIITHIKKASYLLNPRTAETPYTFIIVVDGKEFKEEVKGAEEIISDIDTEKGKGVHYSLKKRIRIKPGTYEIRLKPEKGALAKIKAEFTGGRVYTLRFEPIYSSLRMKAGFKKSFFHGVIDYGVYLDENKISGK